MKDDISKTIIRVIQDYCSSHSALNLCTQFAITITPSISEHIQSKTMVYSKFNEITKAPKDFYYANEINFKTFNKGLFKKLDYELTFCNSTSILGLLRIFKQKMENGNSRGFPKGTPEDTLRCTLALSINDETFCEARTSNGNSDIIIPSMKIIIETKIWRGKENYMSGLSELNDYLEKSKYSEGYYIVFDYNQTINEVMKEKGEIFDEQLQNRMIHIIFIKMNDIPPSKIYLESKKKKTAGQKTDYTNIVIS
jgi:hypothetical protein